MENNCKEGYFYAPDGLCHFRGIIQYCSGDWFERMENGDIYIVGGACSKPGQSGAGYLNMSAESYRNAMTERAIFWGKIDAITMIIILGLAIGWICSKVVMRTRPP